MEKRNKDKMIKQITTLNDGRILKLCNAPLHNYPGATIYVCWKRSKNPIVASLKDLGKKWFAFNRMELSANELLANLK